MKERVLAVCAVISLFWPTPVTLGVLPLILFAKHEILSKTMELQ